MKVQRVFCFIAIVLKCSFTIRDSVGGWCSGSTLDFDSSSTSSILVPPAKQKHIDRLIGQDGVRKALNVGSTPTQCVSVWEYNLMVK